MTKQIAHGPPWIEETPISFIRHEPDMVLTSPDGTLVVRAKMGHVEMKPWWLLPSLIRMEES